MLDAWHGAQSCGGIVESSCRLAGPSPGTLPWRRYSVTDLHPADVEERGTYGYRRVWGVLRYQQFDQGDRHASHKRVNRVRRDHGLLLYRRGQRPVDSHRHDGKVAVEVSNTRWCSDGFELACDNGERVRVPLRWIAATGKS